MIEEVRFEEDEFALPTGERAQEARRLLEDRLRAARDEVDRDLESREGDARPTRPDSRSYLFEEACELYVNELNWEELTDEERIADGSLTEMVFPGLLTFLDALLPGVGEGEPDHDREHRDVVHDFLLWLSDRLLRLRAADPGDRDEALRVDREAKIVDELIDLVVARLYGLDQEETGRIRG